MSDPLTFVVGLVERSIILAHRIRHLFQKIRSQQHWDKDELDNIDSAKRTASRLGESLLQLSDDVDDKTVLDPWIQQNYNALIELHAKLQQFLDYDEMNGILLDDIVSELNAQAQLLASPCPPLHNPLSADDLEHSPHDGQTANLSPHSPRNGHSASNFEVLFTNRNPSIDVVFVHGLNGQPHKTWEGQNMFWPRDLLPKAMPICRVVNYTCTDRANVRKGTSSIDRLASDFIDSLIRMRRECENRRLIFVAHSLGGILVKKALLLSYKCASSDIKRSMFCHTVCVIFMGTPHTFSSTSAKFTILRRMASALSETILAGTPSPTQLFTSLVEPRHTDSELSAGFKALLDQGQIKLCSFFESNAMNTQAGPLKITDSFMQLFHPLEVVRPLPGNHCSMCKFEDAEQEGFGEVMRQLEKMLPQDLQAAIKDNISSFSWRQDMPRIAPMALNVKIDPFSQNLTTPSPRSFGSRSRSRQFTEGYVESLHLAHDYSEFRLEIDVPLARWKSIKARDQRQGDWILASKRYCSWFKHSSSSPLYIHGPAGCGKTMAAESIFERLQRLANEDESFQGSCFIHMFFRLEESALHTTKNILRAFIAQLLDQTPDLIRHITRRVKRGQSRESIETGTLLAILRSMLEDNCHKRAICVIDAFDECNHDLVSAALDLLKILFDDAKMILIITSRPQEKLRSFLYEQFKPTPIELNVVEDDIYKLAMHQEIDFQVFKVEAYLRDSGLYEFSTIKQSQVVEKLRASLRSNHDNSFPVVNLMCLRLKRQISTLGGKQPGDAEIATLLAVPDIHALYRENLSLLQRQPVEGRTAIAMLACAFEVLRLRDLETMVYLAENADRTLQEVREALISRQDQPVVDCLGELISVDGDGVHLLSGDLRRYIVSHLLYIDRNFVTGKDGIAESDSVDRESSNLFGTFKEYHEKMATACLRMLLLDRDLHDASYDAEMDIHIELPLTVYARKFWSDHLRAAGERANAMELNNLLQLYMMPEEHVAGQASPQDEKLQYAAQAHVAPGPTLRQRIKSRSAKLLLRLATEDLSYNIETLFNFGSLLNNTSFDEVSSILKDRLLEATSGTLQALLNIYKGSGGGEVAKLHTNIDMILCIRQNQQTKLETLLKNTQFEDDLKASLLSVALRAKNISALRLLLKFLYPTNLDASAYQHKLHLLDEAIRMSDHAIVRFLVQEFGSLFNLTSALQIAVGTADENICRCLLEAGAKLDEWDRQRQTPLHLAAATGRLKVVALLLEWKAQPTLRDFRGRTPLHCAAEQGHAAIVACLLTVLTSAEDLDKHRRTPLFLACEMGSMPTARILWATGSNLFHRDIEGRTALHAAAAKGVAPVVQFLLSNGCQANVTDHADRTPLHEASFYGWDTIVEILISSGANVNAKDKIGRRPLHDACLSQNPSVSIVQMLLEARANPHAVMYKPKINVTQPSRSCTALHLAAEYSSAGVVARLLRAKAIVHAKDSMGDSAIDCAIRSSIDKTAKVDMLSTADEAEVEDKANIDVKERETNVTTNVKNDSTMIVPQIQRGRRLLL